MLKPWQVGVVMIAIWLCGLVTGWVYGRRNMLDGLMRKHLSNEPYVIHANA